jgi:hypothetical protein
MNNLPIDLIPLGVIGMLIQYMSDRDLVDRAQWVAPNVKNQILGELRGRFVEASTNGEGKRANALGLALANLGDDAHKALVAYGVYVGADLSDLT